MLIRKLILEDSLSRKYVLKLEAVQLRKEEKNHISKKAFRLFGVLTCLIIRFHIQNYIVPDDVLPARVNQHVMIIRPINGKDMSYYLMFSLCNPDNKNKLFGIAQSGSTREAINKQEMDTFQIILPSDKQIAEFGNIAHKSYSKIKQNSAEIRKLSDMTSILLSQLSSH